eukprot:SAG31_NODE_10356_length_1149_cov_1.262857_1_plen_245_part_00
MPTALVLWLMPGLRFEFRNQRLHSNWSAQSYLVFEMPCQPAVHACRASCTVQLLIAHQLRLLLGEAMSSRLGRMVGTLRSTSQGSAPGLLSTTAMSEVVPQLSPRVSEVLPSFARKIHGRQKLGTGSRSGTAGSDSAADLAADGASLTELSEKLRIFLSTNVVYTVGRAKLSQLAAELALNPRLDATTNVDPTAELDAATSIGRSTAGETLRRGVAITSYFRFGSLVGADGRESAEGIALVDMQ